jgi:hypothetical protein
MSVVHLLDVTGSTVIGLDATSSASYSRTVEVSTSTMFDGSKRSDNVHPNLPSVTFQGIVTSVKVRDTYPDPTAFRKALDELVDSYELMTLYGTDDKAIPDLDNCYITSFNVTRDAEHSDALIADVSVQQLDITSAVTASTVTVPKNDQNVDNPSTSQDGVTTENTSTIETTIGRGAIGSLTGFTSS